ncbi:coiled-coil domain-containing protein [Flavilitoribacter nigricans]|uniref:hypothetical protein n=1 Tax=Flavilitoribacter nigricans TaxID=70997 RepID=UPI000C03E8F6|nr:hypothetical protein [Flavilitoribacter nigricans]
MYCLGLKTRLLTTLIFFSFSTIFHLSAQINEVCQDGDCDPALQSIPLAEPLSAKATGAVDPQRAEQYKAAYQRVQQIKQGHAQTPEWTAKYRSNQLNGKSCLRLNQLESYFAHEYEQNPDFAKFIDQNETDVAAWREDGFQASRRAINLNKRIEDKCPKETRDLEKGAGPSLANLPATYQKLGQVQGYFDKKGNLLKPLEQPAAATTTADDKNLSKKEQIAELKDKVSKLPLGSPMQNKITGIADALGTAQPKLGNLLGNLVGPLQSKLSAFLPGPFGLLSKINAAKDLLGSLKNFVPKIKVGGLLSKIGDLFKKGEGLSKKAKDLVDRGEKLKDKHDKLTLEAEDLKKEMDQRTAAVEKLKQKLGDLAKQKAELTEKLEDKPRKILDDLKDAVANVEKQAGDLAREAEQENQKKDEVLDKVDALEQAKEAIEKELDQLEKEAKDLAKEQEALTEETSEVEAEVEQVKEQEKAVADLAQQLEDLKSEKAKQEELAQCESELKKLLSKLSGVDAVQNEIKKKSKGLFALPGKLLGKLSDLKLFQNKIKLGKNGIPLVGKALAKVDQLTETANMIGSTVELLTGKKTRLQEQIKNIDQKLELVNGIYEGREDLVNGYKDQLIQLIAEKSGLKGKMDQGMADIAGIETQVQDFIKRYNIFDENSNCLDQQELEEKIAELEKQQAETEPELEQLEKELQDAEQRTEALKADTEAAAEMIEEIEVEKAAIKEEFGTEVDLEPVTVEEWSESFQVERSYWDAVFHPDDEVVDGYRGRYFEVLLKDAEKTIKLLFGPGEYYMDKSTFRKTYGPTIGAFATEALQAMKKADRDQVKLFIQGSADLAGHTTFSGNLDERYLYDEVEVLPQKSDPENFSNVPTAKSIPERNFCNDHLPDLRGRYLKEMISIYSKKFDPIILEGAVKQFQDKEERNAIIYLFFPEDLLSTYEKE